MQGDGHPTMAAALMAFGSNSTYSLVRGMLNQTDSGCPGCHVVDDGLMSYPVLWTMSVNDYLWASGDTDFFDQIVPDIQHILDAAVASFLKNPPVQFMGWDDRLDNGFCGYCIPETQLAFAALAARAVADFANSLANAGPSSQALAPKYAGKETRRRGRGREQGRKGGRDADIHCVFSSFFFPSPTRLSVCLCSKIQCHGCANDCTAPAAGGTGWRALA